MNLQQKRIECFALTAPKAQFPVPYVKTCTSYPGVDFGFCSRESANVAAKCGEIAVLVFVWMQSVMSVGECSRDESPQCRLILKSLIMCTTI